MSSYCLVFLLLVAGVSSDWDHARPDQSEEEDDDDDLSAEAIAGICIGVIVIVALIVLIVIVLWKKNNKATKTQAPPPFHLPPISVSDVNSPQPMVLGVPEYAHAQPTYSHNMNPYYIPTGGDICGKPPYVDKSYHGAQLDGIADNSQAASADPPSYAEVIKEQTPNKEPGRELGNHQAESKANKQTSNIELSKHQRES